MLKDRGVPADMAERYIHPPGMKFGFHRDLFGIIDIIACTTKGILGVQSCGNQFSEHLKTITEKRLSETRTWLLSGGLLELWAWRRVKVKRGGKAMTWKPRALAFYLADGKVRWTDLSLEDEGPGEEIEA
jgi:hypothetical protein